MMRSWTIFALCHFYPVFIIWHLMFGDWSRLSQVVFNIVPIGVFGSLFAIWAGTSESKLNSSEKNSIKYLAFMLTAIYLYYCLCVISSAEWVRSHNNQAAAFVGLTLFFYIYAAYERR